MSVKLPRGTITLLLADVEGSARLWETRGEAMAASMELHRKLTDEIVKRHRGARPEEQGEGDSFVAAFERATDAVACAFELQLAHPKQAWDVPIRVRIGLHTGEVRMRGERNYDGPAMNRCARLRALAHGGQTVISSTTRELAVDELPPDVTLADLGPHRLRDLARPEHVWQLVHPDLQRDFPPLRSLDALPNNLPPQLTSFIGREAEIAEVRRLLGESRIVTLTGSGGCGKTRLAVQTGAEVLEGFADGVWLVDLSAISDPDLVARATASALNIRDQPLQPMIETLKTDLRDRRLLIVLDNCEHLIGACADLVDELLVACPHVTILATSREALGVEGEISWRVPSLSFPEVGESAGAQEAVALFCDRAVRARPNFRLTDDNATAIADVCRYLEGIPLAIELAAARVRVMTPWQIASGLNDRFHLLTGGARRAMPRQRTLEASVDWSYDLLRDAEKALLRRLSVFAGGFTLDAAEAVCAGDGIETPEVLDLLTSLVDKSLVQVDDDADEARYRLLETIRLYARQRLVDSGEGPGAGTRHLDFFVAFAHIAQQDPTIGQPSWLARIEAEMDNLRAALDWSTEAGETDKGIRLAASFQNFWLWDIGGHAREVGARLNDLLSADTGHVGVRIEGLLAASQLSFLGYDSPAGVRFCTEALELAREVGDERSQVIAHWGLGFHRVFGSPWESRQAFESALAVAEDTGDDTCLFYGHQGMGLIHFVEGRPAAGRVHLEKALKLADVANIGPVARGFVLTWLGFIAALAGDLTGGRAMLEEAVAILRQVNWTPMIVQALLFMSYVALFSGDHSRARELLADIRSRIRGFDPVGIGGEGLLLLCTRRYEEAAVALERMSRAPEAIGINVFAAQQRALLAEAHITLGRLDAARTALGEAAALVGARLVPAVDGIALPVRARLARIQGDLDLADRSYREALALFVEADLGLFVPRAIEGLAGIAACSASYEEAARLFGAATAMRDDMGYVRLAFEEERYESDVAATREALGPQAFEEAWAQGAAMTMDEAVAYASRAHGPRKRPSAGWNSLTPREIEVARLVAEGLTNPQIGEKLFTSPRTAQTHVRRIFEKVGVSTRAELASEVTRRGL